MANQPQTKSASYLDDTISPPYDNSFRQESFSRLTSCDVKVCLHMSQQLRLISFLATQPNMVGATSLSLSSKTASMISSALPSNRSLMESKDSSSSLEIFYSQKVIFTLISDQQLKILFEFKTSLKLTRNLPPLNCHIVKKAFQWDYFGIQCFIRICNQRELICQ